jgi:hypothetical protein
LLAFNERTDIRYDYLENAALILLFLFFYVTTSGTALTTLTATTIIAFLFLSLLLGTNHS